MLLRFPVRLAAAGAGGARAWSRVLGRAAEARGVALGLLTPPGLRSPPAFPALCPQRWWQGITHGEPATSPVPARVPLRREGHARLVSRRKPGTRWSQSGDTGAIAPGEHVGNRVTVGESRVLLAAVGGGRPVLDEKPPEQSGPARTLGKPEPPRRRVSRGREREGQAAVLACASRVGTCGRGRFHWPGAQRGPWGAEATHVARGHRGQTLEWPGPGVRRPPRGGFQGGHALKRVLGAVEP